MIDSSSGTAAIYYIHPGSLEEPLVMTDGSKAKVWDAYLDPYGVAKTFATPSANIDLRLPGQWYQAEAGGLHQNWNRDYDPSLGRYIQADPLGIKAGQNVYAYVDGKPTYLIDPAGLEAMCVYTNSCGQPPDPLRSGTYTVGVQWAGVVGTGASVNYGLYCHIDGRGNISKAGQTGGFSGLGGYDLGVNIAFGYSPGGPPKPKQLSPVFIVSGGPVSVQTDGKSISPSVTIGLGTSAAASAGGNLQFSKPFYIRK